MITVGKILKKAREYREVSLDQIAEATRIKAEYLAKIENDDFSSFESITYVKGYIRAFANFLDLDSNKVIAVFRRQIRVDETPVKKRFNVIRTESFELNYYHLGILLLIGTFLVVFIYLIRQFYAIQKPPIVELVSPKSEVLTVNEPIIEFRGVVEADTILTINEEQIQLKPDNTFSITYSLKVGENIFLLKSFRKYAREKLTEKKYKIFYNSEVKDVEKASGSERDDIDVPPSIFSLSTTDSVWVQIIVDKVQKEVGIIKKGYNREFDVKSAFKVSSGRPYSTKIMLDGKELKWSIKNGVGWVECIRRGKEWDCNGDN